MARRIALTLLWLLVAVCVVLAVLAANRAGAELRGSATFGLNERALAHARAQEYVWTLASVLLAGMALAVTAARRD